MAPFYLPRDTTRNTHNGKCSNYMMLMNRLKINVEKLRGNRRKYFKSCWFIGLSGENGKISEMDEL